MQTMRCSALTAHIWHTRQAQVPREGAPDNQDQDASLRNQCIGVSRGERYTKFHAVVDTLRYLVHMMLSTGNPQSIPNRSLYLAFLTNPQSDFSALLRLIVHTMRYERQHHLFSK